jgi:hypothetical protein
MTVGSPGANITLGADTVFNTGPTSGTVTFNGPVNGATSGGQSLTVNSGGLTDFKSTVGATTPLASLTTDIFGTSQFAGNVTVSGAAPLTTTPLISINDSATAMVPITLTSTNPGQVSITNFTFATGALTVNTGGTVLISAPLAGNATVGSNTAPLILATQIPLNLLTVANATLTYLAATTPTNLIFGSGSSVSAFLGGSTSAVTQAANATQVQATQTVSSVQGTAAAAVSEAAKAGFDTDSVAQQINYGFVGDVGVAPPFQHRIDETGVSVPEGFGEDEDTPPKK